MSAALITSIVGYLIQYGPTGYTIVSELIDGVRDLQKDGAVPTDEQLKALSDRILAQHAALPKPE